jgi:thiamine biosynthesis lipoprotein
LALATTLQASPSDSSQLVAREAWVMGTRLGVVVEAASVPEASKASENVIREVERLERILSTWDPLSEMQAINTGEVGKPIAPGAELAFLLAEAELYSRISGAAFDARIGALVDAWDLRGAGVIPGAGALLGARKATGPRSISVDERTGMVTRHMAAAWIDTGGFGKGAALRAAANRLDSASVDRALINFGGQLWAHGCADKPWSVYVAHPRQRQRPVARLDVHGVSVATSGASGRFIEIDGVRWGHILDPRTGHPSPAWGSVTVVSADPLEADALATALYVMGPKAGMAWAAGHPQLDALFLEASDGALTASWTRGMEQWLIDRPVSSTPHSQTQKEQDSNHR